VRFLSVGLLAAIEYAWNVYPSTDASSTILLVSHAVLLLGIWSGWPEGKGEVGVIVPPEEPEETKEEQEQDSD